MEMPTWWQRVAISFMNAMFTSRWAFSTAFAISATLMLGALWIPAVTTEP